MVGKGRRAGTTRFSLRVQDGARQAQLAVDSNDWKPLTMRKQKTGDFVAVLALPSGTHEYKFIVDDTWQTDPDNHCWVMNPYGTMNSAVQVA